MLGLGLLLYHCRCDLKVQKIYEYIFILLEQIYENDGSSGHYKVPSFGPLLASFVAKPLFYPSKRYCHCLFCFMSIFSPFFSIFRVFCILACNLFSLSPPTRPLEIVKSLQASLSVSVLDVEGLMTSIYVS